jgi:tetratricopeptide (TPR) repeat protein
MKKLSRTAAVVTAMVIVLFSIISCVTTNKVEQSGEGTPKVETTEPQKLPKKITKADFVEQLRQTLKTGTSDDALKLYDQLPAEYADDFDLLFLKASLLVSSRRIDEADVLCKSLLARDPENTNVMELAAVIAKVRGDKQERSAQLSAIIAKDPNNSGANIELADDAMMQRNYLKAQSYYAKALTKEPDNENALLGYGETCYFLEDDETAKNTFTKVLGTNPQSDQAYYYLGKLAYAKNQYKISLDNT